MPIMPDLALLATGSPDQAHSTARDQPVSVGASGRGAVITFARQHDGDRQSREADAAAGRARSAFQTAGLA
jgi:hypothetical protein